MPVPRVPARRAHVAALVGTAVVALLTAAASGVGAPAASAATPKVAKTTKLVELLGDHTARALPRPHAKPVGALLDYRPLTGQRTVVPLLKTVSRNGEPTWFRVRLPGRPNGRSGWISADLTRQQTTPWHLVVQIALRRVLVFKAGHRVRTYSAVVGKPSTPTPHGEFFVEETVRLRGAAAGAPWALATSARSNALKHYEGGVGQVALHGTGNLVGTPGTAVSHGCVRLRPSSISWLAARIGAGVPVTLRSR
jgi:lipoprotein-anchoring transpeptidase ErfK/SrfK